MWATGDRGSPFISSSTSIVTPNYVYLLGVLKFTLVQPLPIALVFRSLYSVDAVNIWYYPVYMYIVYLYRLVGR